MKSSGALIDLYRRPYTKNKAPIKVTSRDSDECVRVAKLPERRKKQSLMMYVLLKCREITQQSVSCEANVYSYN